MRRDGNQMGRDKQTGARKDGGAPMMPETVTMRMLDLPLFQRMTEAARLLRELADDPEKVEIEVEGGSNYGRVSFVTDYLCWSGRDLETFQRAVSLATELVICSLEGDVFVVELSFPGVFSSFEVRRDMDERGV